MKFPRVTRMRAEELELITCHGREIEVLLKEHGEFEPGDTSPADGGGDNEDSPAGQDDDGAGSGASGGALSGAAGGVPRPSPLLPAAPALSPVTSAVPASSVPSAKMFSSLLQRAIQCLQRHGGRCTAKEFVDEMGLRGKAKEALRRQAFDELKEVLETAEGGCLVLKQQYAG
ncbi:unnamed protein product [Polarella glacialis]|uniref:Uncharacterized protein n=1 Tax=Polarella glacialis TaxID=89957 RepID=A0A813M3N6_POLGL|nr:unnamed protein product [Polarella glacialis]